MNWKQHLIVGLIVALAFGIFTHWKFGWFDLMIPIVWLEFWAIAVVSPLVIDLDHENGKLHNVLIFIGLLLAILGVIGWFLAVKLGLELIGDLWMFPLIMGVILSATVFFTGVFAHHRGFMHSIPFCIIYGAVIYLLTFFNLQMGVLASIVCYSHLIADGEPFKIR